MRKTGIRARILRGLASSAAPSIALVAVAIVTAGVCALPVSADHTRFWRQSDYDEYQKGTAKGVALRSDGKLMLAPKFASLADPNLAYVWALRTDSHGNVYAAGGSYAKVVRVDAAGKMTTVFDSTETSAQAIALDKNDNLYVGTSPDGKVYKVTPGGQKSVFFDPKTKYIWDLVVGPDSTLYVATGDTGKIFSVTPDGKGDIFYSSDETHIRTLALDGKGNLIAGTEPNGWVMRIPLAGDPPAPAKGEAAKLGERSAFVLYETPKREITAIVPDASGNLYVAAIGEKQRGTPNFPLPSQQQQQPTQNISITVTATAPGAPAAAPPTPQSTPQPPIAFAPFPTLAGSAVYRIAADGSPQEMWSSADDLVYGLALSADGKPILGIGNHGALIELDGDRTYTLLSKTESDQVTGFSHGANGRMYVATANPGGIFSLGPELESEGNFESQTFDAKIFSRWGRLTWWGDNSSAANSAVQFYVRTGNTTDPTKSWSPWSGPLASGAMANSPASRFVQWKTVLHGSSGPAPQVSWVDLAYLPKNVAPTITAIALQDPGVRVTSFGAQQSGAVSQVQLRTPSSGQNAGRSQTESVRFDPPMQGVGQKGFQSVIWSAEDENDDELTYAVYYRGENEKDWRLLKDKLDQKFYSWDTTSMPDGAYYLKIAASDIKSNPPEDALQSERESERFVVDNTPPQVSEMAADTSGDTTTIKFRVTDATSPVVRTQYSFDAGDWIPLRPSGELSDSLDERYVLTLRPVTAGNHTLSVRVYDQYENEAAGKVDFSASAAKR